MNNGQSDYVPLVSVVQLKSYLESEAGSKLRKQTARKTPQANEFARLIRIPIFGEKFPSWLQSSVSFPNSKRHLGKNGIRGTGTACLIALNNLLKQIKRYEAALKLIIADLFMKRH